MKTFFKKQQTSFVYSRFYLSMQKKWAEKMSSLTEGFSKRKLIFFLALFTVLTAGYFLYNIYSVFSCESFQERKAADTSRIKTIQLKK